MLGGQDRSERVPGSFRDPSGYVFRRDDRIFRAVTAACHDLLRALADAGTLSRFADRLVETRFVEDPALLSSLRAEHDGYSHFLAHEPIDPITYPHEWSVSMLADAGLLTLDIQRALLAAGCSLKDASAYNVQFVQGRPRFIDVSSIECPERVDLWSALGQFGRMFLFPLLLCRYHGWDLRSYFVANLGGRSAQQILRGLGQFQRWRPRFLLDVTLPELLRRTAETRLPKGALRANHANARPQLLNLARLRRKIEKLAAGYRPSGVWHDYASTCHYTSTADEGKKALVSSALAKYKPARVVDLGCNTGDYSFLAAAHASHVIAVDADHDAIEQLYRRLRVHPANITPLAVDICNPSPGIGYMNTERASFFDRIRGDCVLALALIHHLRVAANLPLPAIRDLLYRLTTDLVVLEFVPRTDPMFERLIALRTDRLDDYDLNTCKKILLERFALVNEEPIPGSPRTLLTLRKQSSSADHQRSE